MRATVAARQAAATRLAREKPRLHDTSRISWAKPLARVGGEFPLECPNCGGDIRLNASHLVYQCETIPGLRTFGNLPLLRTSGPRAGANPENPRTLGRAARAASAGSGSRAAHRVGQACASARRLRDRPGLTRRVARDRHSQPLSGGRREASKHLERRTGSRSAAKREKSYRSGA